MKKIILLALALLNWYITKAQFTQGNIVVLSVGDGTSSLANTGNAIRLIEYNNTGIPTGMVVTVPTSGVSALGISGTAGSEGALHLSSNSNSLVFTGYHTDIPYSANLSGSTSSAVPRGIGRVLPDGTYELVTTTSVHFSANNPRSAITNGNGDYWMVGANTGIVYMGKNGEQTVISSTITNNRSVKIYNNDLYFSTGSGTRGLYKISGTPTTGTITSEAIITFTGSSRSPYGFDFNPTMTAVYIGDDATVANGGGIQKFTFDGISWNLQYTISISGTSARDITVDWTTSPATIYAITSESAPNRLVKIVDNGASSTPVTLVTAPTNVVLRGVAFSPSVSLSSSKSILSFSVAGVAAQISGLSINVTVPSSVLLSTAVGTGTISALATVNPAFPHTGFSGPVLFTVTAQDLSTQTYTVTAVNAPSVSSEKDILTFSIQNQSGPTTISGTSIMVAVPFGTNITNLTATGTISPLATVSPNFANAKDYTGGVVYTVTAQDFTTEVYTVQVQVLPASSAKDILTFSIQNQSGPTTISGTSIMVAVPFGTNITNLTATGTISPLATVSPNFANAKDYTGGVVYTVTAQDLTTKVYTVQVQVLPAPPASYNVDGVVLGGVVSLVGTTYVQDFNSLGFGSIAGWYFSSSSVVGASVATFAGSNSSWTQTSGNFRNVASGTLHTGTISGSMQNEQSNRAIAVRQTSSFGDPGATFAVKLANTKLKANFNLSFVLSSLDPSSPRVATWMVEYGIGETPSNFTSVPTTPASLSTGGNTFSNTTVSVNFGNSLDDINDIVWIRIRVSGPTSGSSNRPTSSVDDFNLTFQETSASELQNSKSITGFSLAGSQGSINGNIISVTIPSNINLNGLTATGVLSSSIATVNPAFATPLNYNNTVTFTVTAANLSTNVYTVNVVLGAPQSSANSILGFTLVGQVGSTEIDHGSGIVSLTVAGGTYIQSVSPTSVHISPLASISPSTTTSRNFSTLVVYTVTAEDLSPKVYTVTVTSLPVPTLAYDLTVVGINQRESFNTVPGGSLYFTGWRRVGSDGNLLPGSDPNHMAATVSVPSTGYTVAGLVASGGVNAVTSNGSTTGFGMYMITSGGYNTTNWKNLKVNWGYRATSTFTKDGTNSGEKIFPVLEWSSDGATWYTVTGYNHRDTWNSTWNTAIVGAGASLPIQAENKLNMYFRFKITTVPFGSGNYRFDDFVVFGETGVNEVSSAKEITSFRVTNQIGETTISGNSISFTLPSGSVVNSIAPMITVSAFASISPASGVALNFTNPVVYAVTAQDGSIKNYTVTAFVLPTLNTASSILEFAYLPQPGLGLTTTVLGTINGANIEVNMPAGVTITGLVPTITLSAAATSDPAVGVAPNYFFSSFDSTYIASYTVTAEDPNFSSLYQVIIRLNKGSGVNPVSKYVNTGKRLLLYPNPVRDVLYIESESSTVVRLYNALGIELHTFTLSTGKNQLSLSDFKPGLYVLRSPDGGTLPFVIK